MIGWAMQMQLAFGQPTYSVFALAWVLEEQTYRPLVFWQIGLPPIKEEWRWE